MWASFFYFDCFNARNHIIFLFLLQLDSVFATLCNWLWMSYNVSIFYFLVYVLSELFSIFISFMFLADILLASCFVDVQNFCKAAISKHRTFVALKESTIYKNSTYTPIATKVRKNLYFHLLVKCNFTYERMNLLRITQSHFNIHKKFQQMSKEAKFIFSSISYFNFYN